jgi:hypothetical protein
VYRGVSNFFKLDIGLYHTSREMLQSLRDSWDGTNRLGTICSRTIHFEQLDCQRNHDHPIGGIDVPSFADIRTLS